MICKRFCHLNELLEKSCAICSCYHRCRDWLLSLLNLKKNEKKSLCSWIDSDLISLFSVMHFVQYIQRVDYAIYLYDVSIRIKYFWKKRNRGPFGVSAELNSIRFSLLLSFDNLILPRFKKKMDRDSFFMYFRNRLYRLFFESS